MSDEGHPHCYGTGEFPYAGIVSVLAIIHYIYKHNDVGHPLLNNMRNGRWLVDYHLNRIQRYTELYSILKPCSDLIYQLPRGLRPLYLCKFFVLYYKYIHDILYYY